MLAMFLKGLGTQLRSPDGSPQQLCRKQDRLRDRNIAVSIAKLQKGSWTNQGGCGHRTMTPHGDTTEKGKEQGSRQELMGSDNLIKDSLPTFTQRQPCRTNLIY